MRIFEKQNFNIPNMLSFFRIVVIIPFAIYFLNDDYLLSALFLLLSGLSDMLDGFIARKFNQITMLGKILDPLADKLTLTTVISCMGIKFPELIPVVVILILKDACLLLGGMILLKKGIKPIAARWYGKLATIFFYTSIIVIVGLKAIWGITNLVFSLCLLLITSILMLFSLFKYFLIFLSLIKNN